MFDEAKFRAKLADAVTVALNLGTRLAPYRMGMLSPRCACPLGCLLSLHSKRYPGANMVSLLFPELPVEWASDFILGFDRPPSFEGNYPNSEAFQLGSLYRQRFVEGIKR